MEFDNLYASLAQRQPVMAAQRQAAAIYESVQGAGNLAALRLACGKYKRLQDEVRPTLIYAASELPRSAEIQFHVDNGIPDATAWPDPFASPILIEVTTVALGRVRHRQMTVLNETGVGHGYTDATDDDSSAHIKKIYEDYRGYAPDEAARTMAAGIRRCVKHKRHLDCTVVIAAPLEVLSVRHWDQFMPEIAGELPKSQCQAIFVVGSPDGRDACYRIK